MMKLLWHPLAMADREHIIDFIAGNNPLAALALDESFDEHAERAQTHPDLYRPGRLPGTREVVAHPNYVMVYRVEKGIVTILRVLHAAQRWPSSE